MSEEQIDYVGMMADMAQVVAHRIRGLVTTIEGFTDLLADTLPDREQRELALRIFEGAARIESVLADLQLFARQVETAPAPTTPAYILTDLYNAIDESVVSRLDLEVTDSSVRLEVDRVLIRQTLLMLVQNAFDAVGGDGRVAISAEQEGGRICFHVRNPGVMRPDVEACAFRPFFTTKAHNLGVGLSISRRIAEAHGGDLLLTANSPAEGTRFTLSLPSINAGDLV
ncbi:MAG: ATP-binding protein [Bacteroidota bacterium]